MLAPLPIGERISRALLPKYVKRVRSKGKDYYYFDTGKLVDGKKVYVRLPALRSSDFGGSYAALMGHRTRNAGVTVDLMRVPKLVGLYEKSPAYRALKPASKKRYDIYLRKLERLLPTAPVVEITKGDMRKLVDGMADKPGAANAFLATASALFTWAIGNEYMAKNPCDGIPKFKMGEHQPWPPHILRAALKTDDDTIRLVAHLLYYTAQRIGDVLRMAWSDIYDDRVAVAQEKTEKKLRIRLHGALKVELAKHPRAGLLICVDAAGAPLKRDTVSKWLSEYTVELGHRCVPHGLRKNAVIALLEAGCPTGEIAAVSGQSLQMVEHYAKQRDQERLADAAILRWENKP